MFLVIRWHQLNIRCLPPLDIGIRPLPISFGTIPPSEFPWHQMAFALLLPASDSFIRDWQQVSPYSRCWITQQSSLASASELDIRWHQFVTIVQIFTPVQLVFQPVVIHTSLLTPVGMESKNHTAADHNGTRVFIIRVLLVSDLIESYTWSLNVPWNVLEPNMDEW